MEDMGSSPNPPINSPDAQTSSRSSRQYLRDEPSPEAWLLGVARKRRLARSSCTQADEWGVFAGVERQVLPVAPPARRPL